MEGIVRAWLETYALGGTVTASTEITVRPRGVLAAGEPGDVAADRGVDVAAARPPAASTCRRQHLHHINHGGNPCKECGWPT